MEMENLSQCPFKEWMDACATGHGWKEAAEDFRDALLVRNDGGLSVSVPNGCRIVARAIGKAIDKVDTCGGHVNIAVIQDNGVILREVYNKDGTLTQRPPPFTCALF